MALMQPKRSGLKSAWRRLAGFAAWAAFCLAPGPDVRAQAGHQDLTVSFKGVVTITNLAVSSGPALGQVTLRWTAPVYTGSSLPLSYDIRVATSGNMSNDADFSASPPLSAFSTATLPSPAAGGTPQSFVVGGLTPGAAYCFAVRAFDSGTPKAVSGWYRIPARGYNVNNCSTAFVNADVPDAPYGLALKSSSSTATLSWMPVRAFASGISFENPAAPAPAELSDYRVYRATAPGTALWAPMAIISTATFSWQDLASGPQYYYAVKAENPTGLSRLSTVRANAWQGCLVAPEGLSMACVPKVYMDGFIGWGGDPATAYSFDVSSSPADLGALGGRVFKSISFNAKKGGVVPVPILDLKGEATIMLHYDDDGAGRVAASAAKVSPDQMSVYWFNGSKWVQLYGKLDVSNRVMSVQTQYLGKYQLRSVERTGGFNFDPAGLSNRLITPNGDNRNDFIVFTFDNPRDSVVIGRIFDLKGAYVADMAPGPVGNSLMWDGKANGRPVVSGIYVYQIEAEGRLFNGTVVVVR